VATYVETAYYAKVRALAFVKQRGQQQQQRQHFELVESYHEVWIKDNSD